MNGNICIVSDKGWAVSNDATLDYHKHIVDTPEGRRTIGKSVFEVKQPYGKLEKGDMVQLAFHAEDQSKVSYTGVVILKTPSRADIEITGKLNEYKQIIERVIKWQTTH